MLKFTKRASLFHSMKPLFKSKCSESQKLQNIQFNLKDFNNNLPHQQLNKQSFQKIKEYFERLNQDQSHFVNSNDICTPLDCVKTMVDKIPKDFWQQKKLKILDCCCGNGNFHSYITTKTNLQNLYFNEINLKRIDNVKKYFGENINLTTKDFLIFPDIEKYDLVVANPPYAKFNGNLRVSKNHNLSRDFILKSN